MESNHIRLVYYYQSSQTREPGEITKKLRESLAYTLNYYPIITGRLVKKIDGLEENHKWKVKSNDGGVRMIEARATGSVEEWLKNVTREDELKLVHWEDMYHLPYGTYYWSTFYVQITEFESGGLAIGLSCSHLLADSTCAMMFIRAWDDLTRSKSMMAPPLFHTLPPRRFDKHRLISDHKLLNHYIQLCSIKASQSNMTNKPIATVTILFPDPLVKASEIESGDSIIEILAGLFWLCVSRAKGKTNELMDMSLCLDVRKLLRLDQGYFGNCLVYHKVDYTKQVKIKDSLLFSQAVQEIQNTIKGLYYETVMDLIEWLSGNSDPISNGLDLVCTYLENLSSSRPMMFEEDIILNHVSCYVEGHVAGGEQVIVLPSPSGEGSTSRVVMVSLPLKEMVKVLEDELLLSFSPVLFMRNEKQTNQYNYN